MIKEAIDRILELAEIQTEKIGDQVFTNSRLEPVYESLADKLVVRNLTGLVDYLKADFDQKLPVVIHIESPTRVSVVTGFNRDFRRNTLIVADALLPNIRFDAYYDLENFNVLLQSCFVPNDTRDKLLRIVGNVKDENVTSYGDDGISQSVTAKTGIATFENVPLPNPVNLKPFRTFVEIAQPESAFIFRMKDGPSAALFEADGGEWKLRAIDAIKLYLLDELGEQIKANQVILIG